MSLEENFRNFYGNFANEQDLGKVKQLFNELYHEDFVNELDGGSSLNKEQLWKIQTIRINTGAVATVLLFKYVKPDVVEYKIHFKGTEDPVGKTVHCAYELKDGQIYRGRAVDESSIKTISNAKTALTNFQRAQEKARTLFALFDGVPKAFDEEMDRAFDALYHEDFVHNMDDQPHNKAQWKERLNEFAETGTKISLLKFEPKDDIHFDASIRVVNSTIDVVGNSRGTVRGSSVLKIEPYDHSKASYASMPGEKARDCREFSDYFPYGAGQKEVRSEEGHTNVAISQ